MGTSKISGETEYSIAAVSKLTGVSCHALRVWERRYGFPVPHRSASGHRRYSRDQVRLLRRISDLSREGRAISELIADTCSGRLVVESASAPDVEPVEARVVELVDRLIAGDLEGGRACFDRLASEFEPADLITRVIGPALVDTGERWFRHEVEIYQERSVTGFLHGKLEVMIEAERHANDRPTRKIIIGTVQGDRHAGGVLILHWMMEHVGWRVLDLGVDLPVRELQKAVNTWQPDAIGLSFVLSRNINKRFQELSQLRELPIFVGGRSILNYQGLARRHGLIPVPGPVSQAVPLLLDKFDEWARGRRPLSAS